MGRTGATSVFHWLIVDKTHGVVIFNHSCDELSFSQPLCGVNRKITTVLWWRDSSKQDAQRGVRSKQPFNSLFVGVSVRVVTAAQWSHLRFH